MASIDPDKTINEQFTNAAAGTKKISSGLVAALVAPAVRMFKNKYQELVDRVGPPGKPKGGIEDNDTEYAYLNQVWANFVLGIAGEDYPASPMGSDADGLKVMVPTFNEEVSQYTPVFPVSDERGYEVTGAYRYGRGLTVQKGGNFETLQKTNPFQFDDVAAVDSFIQELSMGVQPSKALGKMAEYDPEGAAALAAAVAVANESFSSSDILESPGEDPDHFDTAFTNFTASSRQASQKVTATNAAYKLADLGVHTGRSVCSCKGAEADVLLEAFGNQEFVSVNQPDAVQTFLADKVLEQQVAWAASQNALRGTTMDSSTRDLAGAFEASKGVLQGAGRSLVGTLEDAKTDIATVNQEIADNVNDLPEDFMDDVDAAKAFLNPNPDAD